jgi:murein peptide amidase A
MINSMNLQARKTWAKSASGLPIDLYASPNFKWTQHERPIAFLGGVHGDEPEGVWLAEATLEWLRKATAEPGTPEWLLIPCLNPDGYSKNQRVNSRGVDLNRNFPNRDWSPDFPKDRYYPGPAPSSEPETNAILDLIERYKPQIIIHCHSWEPCIVLTGTVGKNCADYLAQSSGYTFKENIGYPTPGSLGDYAWYEKQIPVICIEVAEKIEKEKVWPLFESGIKKVFRDGCRD